MRLQIRPNKEQSVHYVEIDLEAGGSTDVNIHMMNFYATERVRREALLKIKASLHAYADSLTEEDLEIL